MCRRRRATLRQQTSPNSAKQISIQELPGRRGGYEYYKSFMKRHSHLKMLQRAALEMARKDAISSKSLAAHLARVALVYIEFQVLSPSKVANIDESGIYTRTEMTGRAKAAKNSKGRSNAVDPLSCRTSEHITIMPVVSATGKILAASSDDFGIVTEVPSLGVQRGGDYARISPWGLHCYAQVSSKYNETNC